MAYTVQNDRWADQRLKKIARSTMPGLSMNKPGKPSALHPLAASSVKVDDATTFEQRLNAINEYFEQERYKGGQPIWWDAVMKPDKEKNEKKQSTKVIQSTKAMALPVKKKKKVRFADHVDIRIYQLDDPRVFMKRIPPFPSHSKDESLWAGEWWEFYGWD